MIKRFAVLISLMFCTIANAQTYTIALQPSTPGYDAIIKSANGTTNYGTDTKIRASRNTLSQYERSLLKFDLAGIPAQANIVTASLVLVGSVQTTSVSNAAYLQIVTKSWEEGTITWNTATGMSGTTGQISLAASTGTADSYTLNVAAALQTMLNTQNNNFGWQLLLQTESNASNAQMEFYSSDDATASNRPKLIVTYELPIDVRADVKPTTAAANSGSISLNVSGGAPPFTYAWSNSATTKDISGLSAGVYTVTVTDANSFQAKKLIYVPTTSAANTFTLLSDALSFKDAKVQTASLDSKIANTNFGTFATNQALIQNLTSGWNVGRSLLAFDLNSIPSNATITSGVLKMVTLGLTETLTLNLIPVTQNWDENTVTWNNQPAVDNSASITFTVASGITTYTFDVASHAQKMIQQGTSLYGWQVRLQSEATGTVHTVSFRSSDATLGWPELALSYTVPTTNYDTDYNWTKTEVFDENENVISSSKVYSDALGRSTQSLNKNAVNEVFTSQTVYDQYGRPALNTMPAFTGNTLLYQDNFFKNSTGAVYTYTDYDSPATLNNPNGVQTSSVNSLGYYYSGNNAYDMYQATATHPFSRVEYTGDPLATARRSASPHNSFKMGSGREGWSFSMVSGTELKGIFGNNNSYKVQTSTVTPLTSTAIAMSSNIIATKNVSLGADRKEMISYSVGGKVIATCMSGLSTDNCSITGVKSYMSYTGTKSADIHLPDANKTSLTLPLPVYSVLNATYTAVSSDITYTITDLYTDKVLVANTDYTLNTGTRAVTFSTAFLNLYPSRGLMLRFRFALGRTLDTYLQMYGGTMDAEIAYNVDYGKWSVNYYDFAGNLRKEVSPKGISCGSPGTITMATTYDYSHLGQMIAKKSPDEGLAEYNYDSEGKLRFTQNAEQHSANRFSYIKYDVRGRAVETGEYTTGAVTGSINIYFQNYTNSYSPVNTKNWTTWNIVDSLDGFMLPQTSDVYHTMYEAPAGGDNIPSGYTYKAQYNTKYLNGAVCKTWNDNTATWYCYDAMGRNTATVKQIYDPAYTGIKTNVDDQIKTNDIVYNNFSSLVNKSTFQINVSAEKMEVMPYYDALLRPYQTYVNSPAGSGAKLSEVSFDKMGRAVRTVIGNNLQGVDVVYTLDGRLKAINHPGLDASVDRGGDAADFTGVTPASVNADLFGEIVEYHYNDYEASNTFSINSITSGNSVYDGLIHTQRFKTQNSVNSSTTGADYIDYNGANQVRLLNGPQYTSKELIFNYTYDQYKQLATSVFGTYFRGTNTITQRNEYKESGAGGGDITYDANGNITRLVRQTYSISSTLTKFDDLTYTISSTSNKMTHILDAASNSFSSSVNFKTASTSAPTTMTYNSIGQLTASSDEGISAIEYYASGKPKKITFTNSNYTEYYYGDNGSKCKTVFYDNSVGKKKITWYNGPGIYVLDEVVSATVIALEEMNVPGAQLKKNGSTYDVVYPLTDHLGNVRVTFKESGVGNGINILSYNDYYAWGGVLPGRSWVSGSTFRYGYQSKEKAPDGGLWDQFELRLYNHDLGRWMAPDPYNQFHSPYISMANNPVSAVDPNGGYTNAAPSNEGGRFANKERMDFQKSIGIGAWDWEHTKRRYEDRVKTWADKCGMDGTTEFYSNPRQAERFLEGLKVINAEYMGLGFSGSMLENGGDYMNHQESSLLMSERYNMNAFNGTSAGTSLRGVSDESRGWTKALGANDAVMSSVNAYDHLEDEKKALWGSEYVERQALQGGGMLRAMDKINEAVNSIANKVGDAITGLFSLEAQRIEDFGEMSIAGNLESTSLSSAVTYTGSPNTQSGLQGGEHFVGPALIAAGQPWLATRAKVAGATEGTSAASIVFRKALPVNLPFGARILGTRSLGGAVGRFVPFIGWGMFAYDAINLTIQVGEYLNTPQGQTMTNNYLNAGIYPTTVCFKGNTLIQTNKGFVEISKINIGDSVFTYNLKHQKEVLGAVTNTLTRISPRIFKITTENQEIFVTEEHPFYVKNLGWIKVNELSVGLEFLLANKNEKAQIIKAINVIEEKTQVYNIEVDQNHNYFVTFNKILVHNKKIKKSKEALKGKFRIKQENARKSK